MPAHPDYHGVTDFTDRHGQIRWRYRRAGKTIYLPGDPGTKPFDDAYRAAIEGRPIVKADIVRMPGAAVPKSFDAAWRILKQSAEWQKLDGASTRPGYQLEVEEFLNSTVDGVPGSRWGSMAMPDLRRRHVKAIVGRHAEQPFKARRLMTVLRKLIVVALDEEWIDTDPTVRITVRAETNGHRKWPLPIREQFEAHWPVGTQARTAYALAMWLGNRRSDVARLRWQDFTVKNIVIDGEEVAVEGFEFTQFKRRNHNGGVRLFLPITPMLAEALAPLPRDTPTILTKQTGEPYAPRSLSETMKRWTLAAGIPRGYVLHGLRKTLGAALAETGASTREVMGILGHTAWAQAERYTREADQARVSVSGMEGLRKRANG